MGFTGEKAELIQVRFANEFEAAQKEISRLQKLLNDPVRQSAIQYKRDTHKLMQDMKKAIMEHEGLVFTHTEYIKENLFCNRALTGKWASIVENTLDAYDAKLLGAIRDYDIILLGVYGKKQDARKQPMVDFVSDYRNKNPRPQLELL